MDGKTLATNIKDFVERGVVSEELSNLINSIPVSNRQNVINSHFETSVNNIKYRNASPLFIAIACLRSVINIQGQQPRIEPNQARTAVRILLENGADPNITAPTNRSLTDVSMIGCACYYTDFPTVELLYNFGANINATRYNSNALTVLLDRESKPNGDQISMGAEDQRLAILEFLFQKGFNICSTQSASSYTTEQFHDAIVSMFLYATAALQFELNRVFKKRALTLILEHCYQSLPLSRFRVGQQIKELPKSIYNNIRLNPDEITYYGQLYESLIRNNMNTPVAVEEPEAVTNYAEIYDNEPASFNDPLTAEDDLNVQTCSDRGFIGVMKTDEGYIYECISKQNLAFWNSGVKKVETLMLLI
jgi:hypothetical protein